MVKPRTTWTGQEDPERITRMSEFLAKATAADKLTQYLFEESVIQLRQYHEDIVRAGALNKGHLVEVDGYKGIAVWVPPDTKVIITILAQTNLVQPWGIRTMVQTGYFGFLKAMGWSGTLRLRGYHKQDYLRQQIKRAYRAALSMYRLPDPWMVLALDIIEQRHDQDYIDDILPPLFLEHIRLCDAQFRPILLHTNNPQIRNHLTRYLSFVVTHEIACTKEGLVTHTFKENFTEGKAEGAIPLVWATPDPCQYKNETTGELYNINDLRRDTADYTFTVTTGSGKETIILNFCRGISSACESTTPVSVCLSGVFKEAIGKFQGATLKPLPFASPDKGISYYPTSGLNLFDGPTSVRIDLICDLSVTTLAAPSYARGKTADDYIFTFRTASGCPEVPESEDGFIGLGWVLLIVLLIVVVVYLVGGVLVNRFVRKQEPSVYLLPNVEFWRGFPLLVKDGGSFVYNKAMRRQSYTQM
ncbi:hypothetical protein PROFUN_03898 [Planoprotostelium fungivorum]|uniref:Autophagy-related protein 27 n=1 Tax=Planoprotostelium fungivorum TaxID=1890364 RepID=A0A2P6MTM7_9EUKA|nr:hypothetical protein PROFUN_03898 [Planoprotostelium fungivorum]